MENVEHVLHKRSPCIGGKEDHLQNHIYDLNVIYSEYLYSFINRAAIFHKNITLSIYNV